MITNASLLTRDALREWKSRRSGARDHQHRLAAPRSLRPADAIHFLARSDVLAGIEMCSGRGPHAAQAQRRAHPRVQRRRGRRTRGAGPHVRRRDAVHRVHALGFGHAWDSSKWVSAAETRPRSKLVFPLVACDDDDPSSTARTFAFRRRWRLPGRIGFIAPVSSPFCGACSRLRITADGKVRPVPVQHHRVGPALARCAPVRPTRNSPTS
jgi:hypothetical protein